SFTELKCLAGTLSAVFLALLHSAVTSQKAGVSQFLGDGAAILALGSGIRSASKHRLERPRDTLTNCAALAREAAALDQDLYIEPVSHFSYQERTEHGRSVLIFREVVLQFSAVDFDLARSFAEADAGNRCLAATGAEVEGFLRGFGFS